MNRIATRPRARGRRRPPSFLDDVQHMVLEDVSWDFYELLLKELGDRPIRVTYDRGRLEMMSPLPEHEQGKKIIGRMIETLTVELGMEVASFGSTTFRREDAEKGLEPDECYYFKSERTMRGRKRWNPKKDPPPELVVEMDVTRRSVAREPVYAALGVPEIWRWNGKRLECLELAGGEYRLRERSLIFPFLVVGELTRFVKMRGRVGENAILGRFRAWVREKGQMK
jgi:Uma2 family endonuclease